MKVLFTESLGTCADSGRTLRGYTHVGYIRSLLHVYICLHKGKIEQYISWMQAQKDGQGYLVMKASLCDHSWQFMSLSYVQIWTTTQQKCIECSFQSLPSEHLLNRHTNSISAICCIMLSHQSLSAYYAGFCTLCMQTQNMISIDKLRRATIHCRYRWQDWRDRYHELHLQHASASALQHVAAGARPI